MSCKVALGRFMAISDFVYIWQYTIKPDLKAEFLAAYKSDGEWVALFSRDGNYIKTDLLHNTEKLDIYVTIDYWKTKEARDSFRERYSKEFEDLDRRCEAYTVSEVLIGDFVINDTGAF